MSEVPGFLKPLSEVEKPAMTNLELAALAAELRLMDYLFFYDRILVAMDKGKTMIGRFYVPDGAEEKEWSGTVIAIGGGEMARASGVRPTDRVTFSRWNPTVVKLTRRDGSFVYLNAYHAHDLYVGWRDEEAWIEYNKTLNNG